MRVNVYVNVGTGIVTMTDPRSELPGPIRDLAYLGTMLLPLERTLEQTDDPDVPTPVAAQEEVGTE